MLLLCDPKHCRAGHSQLDYHANHHSTSNCMKQKATLLEIRTNLAQTTLPPVTNFITTTSTTVAPTTTIVSDTIDVYCNVPGVASPANLISDSWAKQNDTWSCLEQCSLTSNCELVHFGCADECYCAMYSSNDLSSVYRSGSSVYGNDYTFWDARCFVEEGPGDQTPEQASAAAAEASSEAAALASAIADLGF